MYSVGDPTSLTLRDHKLVYPAGALVGLTTVTNVSFSGTTSYPFFFQRMARKIPLQRSGMLVVLIGKYHRHTLIPYSKPIITQCYYRSSSRNYRGCSVVTCWRIMVQNLYQDTLAAGGAATYDHKLLSSLFQADASASVAMLIHGLTILSLAHGPLRRGTMSIQTRY
jgi:predicted signal transduction protein with EAL and GGDEF domain